MGRVEGDGEKSKSPYEQFGAGDLRTKPGEKPGNFSGRRGRRAPRRLRPPKQSGAPGGDRDPASSTQRECEGRGRARGQLPTLKKVNNEPPEGIFTWSPAPRLAFSPAPGASRDWLAAFWPPGPARRVTDPSLVLLLPPPPLFPSPHSPRIPEGVPSLPPPHSAMHQPGGRQPSRSESPRPAAAWRVAQPTAMTHAPTW